MGWQVAADANTAEDMYPDQSLYPANLGPKQDLVVPGALNCFELMKAYIETGASGVHFKDQRETGSEKNAIIWEGRYSALLIPMAHHIRHLNATRLAADVCGLRGANNHCCPNPNGCGILSADHKVPMGMKGISG